MALGWEHLEPSALSTRTSDSRAGLTPRPLQQSPLARAPARPLCVAWAELFEEACQEEVSGKRTFPGSRMGAVRPLLTPPHESPASFPFLPSSAGRSCTKRAQAPGEGTWTPALKVEGTGLL